MSKLLTNILFVLEFEELTNVTNMLAICRMSRVVVVSVACVFDVSFRVAVTFCMCR